MDAYVTVQNALLEECARRQNCLTPSRWFLYSFPFHFSRPVNVSKNWGMAPTHSNPEALHTNKHCLVLIRFNCYVLLSLFKFSWGQRMLDIGVPWISSRCAILESLSAPGRTASGPGNSHLIWARVCCIFPVCHIASDNRNNPLKAFWGQTKEKLKRLRELSALLPNEKCQIAQNNDLQHPLLEASAACLGRIWVSCLSLSYWWNSWSWDKG